MAFLNIIGFETGDASEATATGGTLSIQTTVKRTGAYALRVNPTAGVSYYAITTYSTTTGGSTNLSGTSFYETVYFRIATTASANNSPVMRIGNGTSSIIQVRLNIDRSLNISGATTSSNTSALALDTWYRLDVTAVQNGACSLTVDGGTAVTCTGSNNAASAAYLGNRQTNSTYDVYFDDFALSDSAIPGIGQVNILKPNAAGTYSTWTDGAGTSPSNLAEVPHDSDTSYITTTAGTDHTVNLDSASTGGVGGSIGTVKSWVIVRQAGAGGTSFQIRTRSGTTNQDTSLIDPGLTYVPLAKLNDVDFADAGAWAATDLDGLEVGVIHAGGIEDRCTSILAMVWCTGSNPQTVTPTTAALVTATFAPTTRLDMKPTPSTLATVLASFAPTIVNPQSATPGTLAALLASFAPSVSVGQIVTPTTASLALAQFTPLVINPMSATPGTLATLLASFAPNVTVGQIVTPDTLALLTAAFAPLILLPNVVTPGVLALLTALFAPTAPLGQYPTPTSGSLVTAGFEPTIVTTQNHLLTPATAALVIVTFAPVILVPNIGLPRPQLGAGRFYGPSPSSSGRFVDNKTGSARFHGPQRGSGR